MKRTALCRKSPMRSRPRLPHRTEAGREAWKKPHAGYCQCGCSRFSMHLHRHHVVTEAHVRREGGDPWALANSMLLAPDCHANHHSGFRRVPLPNVPAAAVDFAERLMGVDRAALYFSRFYAPEVEGAWKP